MPSEESSIYFSYLAISKKKKFNTLWNEAFLNTSFPKGKKISKQFMVFSILSKIWAKNHYPEYFLKRMCSGKSVFVRFFEKIEGTINCSRDFLTFTSQKVIRRFKTQFSFLGDFIVHFLHTTTFHLGLQQLQSFQDLNFKLAIKTIVQLLCLISAAMMSWVGCLLNSDD